MKKPLFLMLILDDSIAKELRPGTQSGQLSVRVDYDTSDYWSWIIDMSKNIFNDL